MNNDVFEISPPGKFESLTIKQQMIGYKSTISLPPNFFESIIKYETLLKEAFNMKVLEKLIKYYSFAIEHYSSIGNDNKINEYNSNLNLLFGQMEVKKFMLEGNNMEILKKNIIILVIIIYHLVSNKILTIKILYIFLSIN